MTEPTRRGIKTGPDPADAYGMTRIGLLLLERKIDQLAAGPAAEARRLSGTALRRRRWRHLVSRAA